MSKLSADVGGVVKVGMTLCELETDAVDSADAETDAAAEQGAEFDAPPPPPPPRAEPKAAPPPPAPAAPAPAAPGKRAPRAPRPHPLSDTAVRFEGEASVLPNAPRQQQWIPDSVEARREGGGGAKRIVKTSPATRAHAHRLGVELEDCTPTGEGGRVTREDVERAAADSTPSAPAPTPRASAPSAPAAQAAPRAPSPVAYPVDRGEAVERMEMGRTRKVMYKAMGSMGDVPHFG